MGELTVRMRITMVRPPMGVQFCLQRGKSELVGAVIPMGHDLTFEFDVRAKLEGERSARLLGAFVQGPTTGRFLYICVGTYAGQIGSPWSRRVKVPLTGIDWPMVEGAEGRHLAAAFAGTMKDGSPAGASVKLTRLWSVGE